jgi:hypothetical protein
MGKGRKERGGGGGRGGGSETKEAKKIGKRDKEKEKKERERAAVRRSENTEVVSVLLPFICVRLTVHPLFLYPPP